MLQAMQEPRMGSFSIEVNAGKKLRRWLQKKVFLHIAQKRQCAMQIGNYVTQNERPAMLFAQQNPLKKPLRPAIVMSVLWAGKVGNLHGILLLNVFQKVCILAT